MKPKHFAGRGHLTKDSTIVYLPRRCFARQRSGICDFCEGPTTSTPFELFGSCCGEPTGLWRGPSPTPWKKAR